MSRPLSNEIERDRWKTRPGWALLIAALLVFLCCRAGLALEPPTPEQIEEYRRDGTLEQRIEAAKAFGNHLVSPGLSARAGRKLNRMLLETQGMSPDEAERIMAPPPAWAGMPTSGTVKVLALLISFTDYPPNSANTVESITSKLFGNGDGVQPYESLRNYYLRSSYNQLDIQGNVLGWYPAGWRSSVVETDQGRDNLIKAALTYYNGQGHDFTQYDNDGDGEIDYFIVIWTGPHGSWSSFWWGYQTDFSDPFTLDGKTLGKYSWQWEAYDYPGVFSPKTVIHETGHGLGLPDYYDYNTGVGPKGGVGDLDMMDGTWGDHNCFSKFLLDWISPAAYTSGTRTVTLHASGTIQADNAVVVMPAAVQGNAFAEFFMVQNRYRAGNDADPAKPYPSDGLLIWHVDARLDPSATDFLYNNSDTSHKLLRLMEADGLEEIETGNGLADAGDYYTSGKTFGKSTVPNSSNYSGASTGISVAPISPSGSTMSFTLSFDPGPPVMNVKTGSTSLPNGTGSLDLGYVALGRTRDAVFTVENLGETALHLTGSPVVQVTRSDAADFTVVAGPVTPVAPGGSTPFTVRFTPSSGARKTVVLSIPNDDPGRNPYTVTVTGTGRPLYGFPFLDDFSTDKGWLGYEPGGWTRGPATAGVPEHGNPDPALDHTATTDNYLLGFVLGADYPNDLPEKEIVSPAIDCTGRSLVYLKFWRWLNVEEIQYDHAGIYVGTDGLTWTKVWENPAVDLTDGAWSQVDYDISSYAGNQSSVYIKFTMGPTDSSWRFSGWNIDDLTVTSADEITPPSPDPMTWASVPTAAGTASVSMTATTASDATGPVSYFFDFTDSPSGGSGGADSAWQASTSYTDAGLQANHRYGYQVKAKDGAGNETQFSTPTRYVYTAIETPSAIGFGTVTSGSIQAQSANTPSGLTRGSSGLLVENTTAGTNSGWKQNNDPWPSVSLSPNTGYSFRAKARNGDGTETAYSTAAVKYTLSNAPATGVFSDVTQACIRAGWGANGNPSGTQYHAENQTAGTNSGWVTATAWDSCGLSCGTTYSFRVRAKNGEAAETGLTSLGSQATAACDTTPPGNPVGLVISPAVWTHVNSFSVTWTNPVDPSGIAAAWYRMGTPPASSTDGTRVAGAGIQALNGLAAPAEGETALYVWLEDGAGNRDHTNRGQAALRYDGEAPTAGTLSINGGSATTHSLTVDLSGLGASDLMSGLSQMCFSNSAGGPWSSPEAYAPARTGWDLSAYGGSALSGQKTVYVKYLDNAGNWSLPFSAAITYQVLHAFPFWDDFSTDKGWVGYETGKWERDHALAGSKAHGYPDPDADHTATGDDMILGYAIGADYPDGLAQEVSIVSPPIDCTGHDRVLLTYWRHLNVQARPYDHATVYASSDGISWVPVWENPAEDLTDDAWTFVAHDISAVAADQATVYIKFAMGPTDASQRFSGWNIDDLALTSEAIYPAEGTLGTELTIWGTGFGIKKGKVLVGSLAATVSSWTDKQIAATLKKAASPDAYDVAILPKGSPAITGKYDFEVSPPRIRSLEPEFGSAGEQVTLRGMFFGTKGKIYLEYQVNGATKKKSAKSTFWHMDPATGESTVTFPVPSGIPSGTSCVLTVVNTVGSAAAAEPFLIK